MNTYVSDQPEPIGDEDLRTADLPLFEALAPESRRHLLGPALMQTVPAGETLFEQGDSPQYLHVLLEGAVELRGADRSGNQAVVEVVQSVDSFVLAAVVTDARYLMGARTLEPCRVLLIPAEHLRAELYRQPALSLALLATMARHYRGMVRQVKDLKLRTSAERVASFLVQLAREECGSGPVQLPYPKRVLAERMGMTPEHLSRAFARLRDRGVQMNGSRILIDDLDTLAAFCRVDTVLDSVEDALRIPGLEGELPSRDDPSSGG